jgi:hypothetical protein
MRALQARADVRAPLRNRMQMRSRPCGGTLLQGISLYIGICLTKQNVAAQDESTYMELLPHATLASAAETR